MDLYVAPRFAPLPDSKRTQWPELAAQLHARPGEWAAIGCQPNGRWPLNRAQLAGLGLECVTRSNGDGTTTVWMRGIEGQAPERVRPNNQPTEPPPATRPTYKWFKGERRTMPVAA